jgi:DNA-binding NarL/FixJ family response regulator
MGGAAPEGHIRVALVEDDAATRDGLRWLVTTSDGFECVGAYASVAAALDGLDATTCAASTRSSR